jgi:hypothetical protein
MSLKLIYHMLNNGVIIARFIGSGSYSELKMLKKMNLSVQLKLPNFSIYLINFNISASRTKKQFNECFQPLTIILHDFHHE